LEVYLLRGNHELRNVQDMFQFHGECRRKFGLDLGEQIWEEINRCFDAMPICKKKISLNKNIRFMICSF
jgi:hypothetical protein